MTDSTTTAARAADHSEGNVLLGLGAYFTLLAAVRLRELLTIPPNFVPRPEDPPWLFTYFDVLIAVMLLSGLSLLAAGVLARRGRAAARALAMGGAGGVLVFTAAHAWFLWEWETAFADGGMIWGFVYHLALLRAPTTATPAGITGFRIGQVLGTFAWVGCAALAWLLAKNLARSPRASGAPVA